MPRLKSTSLQQYRQYSLLCAALITLLHFYVFALVGLAAAAPLQVLSPATVAWASVYLQRFSKLPGLGAQPIVH